MFIGLSANPSNKLRSEERNSGRASALQNDSAPPNGAGGFGAPRSINMSPLTGLKSTAPLTLNWSLLLVLS